MTNIEIGADVKSIMLAYTLLKTHYITTKQDSYQ